MAKSACGAVTAGPPNEEAANRVVYLPSQSVWLASQSGASNAPSSRALEVLLFQSLCVEKDDNHSKKGSVGYISSL